MFVPRARCSQESTESRGGMPSGYEVIENMTKKWRRKKPSHSKPKVVIPPNHYHNFTKDVSIDADVVVPPDLFSAVASWFHEGSGKEITGYGVLDDSRSLVWVTMTDIGQSGFVNNSADGAAEAMATAMADGYNYIDFHWHTHPDMGPFYSATDKEHHSRAARRIGAGGDMTYVVVDGFYWCARRIITDKSDGSSRWNDGVVTIEGAAEPLPSQKYSRADYVNWRSYGYEDYGVKPTSPTVTYPIVRVDNDSGDAYDDTSDVPLCHDCYTEMGGSGCREAKIGEVCWVCSEIAVEGKSTLSTRAAMLADEAEERLDEYLRLVESGPEPVAYGFFVESAGRECFGEMMKLIKSRPGLMSIDTIVEHVEIWEAVYEGGANAYR